MPTPEQAAQSLADDYRATFFTEAGQRVLADLSQRFSEGMPVFRQKDEPWQPPFRDGAQSVVRFIRLQMSHNPNTKITPTVKK